MKEEPRRTVDEASMNDMKERLEEMLEKAKSTPKSEADAPTYRTVLMAASVGVLIGLLLRR